MTQSTPQDPSAPSGTPPAGTPPAGTPPAAKPQDPSASSGTPVGCARPAAVQGLLAGFPVVVDLPVAWGEMDAMGHVNGVVFIRYFETSRFTYFARLEPALEGMGTAERGWILASLDCRYRAPLTFPDTVSVGTRVAAMGSDRYVMEHRVVSHRLERVAAEGEVLIVCYDYRSASKTPLTAADRGAISAVEGREPEPMRS